MHLTHMSKRGSNTLRYALVNATWNVIRNNVVFYFYYNVRRTEGNSHYNALEHCANMLIKVIRKVPHDEVTLNLEPKVYMPISIDFEKAL